MIYDAVAFKLKLGTNDLSKYSLTDDRALYVIEEVPKPINMIAQNRDLIVNDVFKFNATFVDAARNYFNHLRQRFRNKNLTFVGVHVRLSDKGSMLADLTGGGQMLMPREIRFLIGKAHQGLKSMGYKHLIYVLASEKLDWVRRYVIEMIRFLLTMRKRSTSYKNCSSCCG